MTRAELVEKMARAMCEAALGPKQCPCQGKEFKCADAYPAFQATARERAAFAAGWLAAREACIQGTLGESLENEPDNDMDRAYMTALAHVVDTLRALPLPTDAAAALRARQAQEDGDRG